MRYGRSPIWIGIADLLLCVVRRRLSLYSDRELDRGGKSVPVRVEVTGLNPQVIILLAGHFALDHGAHTVNVVSFDLSADGKIYAPRAPA
jgi:hypothetical protein